MSLRPVQYTGRKLTVLSDLDLITALYGPKYGSQLISQTNKDALVNSAKIIVQRGDRYCDPVYELRGSNLFDYDQYDPQLMVPHYQHIGVEYVNNHKTDDLEWEVVKYVTWSEGTMFVDSYHCDIVSIVNLIDEVVATCENEDRDLEMVNRFGFPVPINWIKDCVNDLHQISF